MNKKVYACFYCKSLVSKGVDKCPQCSRKLKVIELEIIEKRVTSWWNIFNPMWIRVSLKPRYQYILNKYPANKRLP